MGTVKYPSMHRTASHNKIVLLLMVPKVQELCSTHKRAVVDISLWEGKIIKVGGISWGKHISPAI